MALTKFLKKYKPMQTSIGITKPKDLKRYKDLLPAVMFELWEAPGFGKYNDGLLEIINPNDFQATLATWLGKKVPNYIPIALSGFGYLFYYRRLTETDEDVCFLNPHYGTINATVWRLEDFFNNYLCSAGIMDEVLQRKLFRKALKKHGPLKKNEIYFYAPALSLGGAPEIDYIEKGNCQVQLDMLFQIRAGG